MATTTLPRPGRGYALNCTRQVFLATELRIADGYFKRLIGLLATRAHEFVFGRGLWIEPSKGVHAIGMKYAIDALYLDAEHRVIHIEAGLRPWRVGAVRHRAAGVLELPAGAVQHTRTEVGDQIRIHSEMCVGPVAR